MLKLRDLCQWSGKISRGPFLLWAGILFAIKYNVDRLLLLGVFHREWSLFSYFEQPFAGIQSLSPAQNPKEALVLLLVSLPFLWVGLVLCVKRLRSAHLPFWLVVLFVAPIAKWFLFVALGIVPERDMKQAETNRTVRWLPKSLMGSAALAVVVTAFFALVATFFSTVILHGYGWGLFVGVPFCMGFFSVIIYSGRQPRGMGESMAVATASLAIAGVVLLVVAFEGVVCLIMAAPLALITGLVGAVAGHAVMAGRRQRSTPQLFCVPILAMPMMFASEALLPDSPPVLKVVTAVEVEAPIETVWKHVVEFAELPPPTELIFKLGIAYPIRAAIQGKGKGAVRTCTFSTGPFVEPIEVWNEPRLLKFRVTSNPAPLQEWTPYKEIHPPHLNGFLVSEDGQFQLTQLPGNRSRLEGTTWYRHTMWPARYWQIWSDGIIHLIHYRVLNHVKELAEREPRRKLD